MSVTIRPVAAGDRTAWEALFTAYGEFYKTAYTPALLEANWRRLHDPAAPIFGLVAEAADGALLGLLHYVPHPHTNSARMVGYLEDLFVAPDARGQRVGEKLVDALVDIGKTAGWYRIYWHTHADNATARKLYDRVAKLSAFVRYDIPLVP
ncbi:GNAT family N-acetyltransferase [Elstera cyanobacteriorum]|uniref:GNAT family N-acetyltransferase n=1 Tax=Elstera cyanobacteriorum TaxID=2022747 RepID=UPI002355A711|nr:GNAT family N-acetyltransferase [Elstera cyanobacteriorum]MCK6443846.1 GNAT family N-acetyltransferase [Elstera cyanobacteriorum]